MRNRLQGYFDKTQHMKLALCGIAVLILMYLVLVEGYRNISADRGERAAEGIQLTSKQAEDMTQTAADVSVLIEDTVVSPESSSQPSNEVSSTSNPDRQDSATERTQAWYATRIEELSRRWSPRYEAAILDIDTFEHRFRTASSRLEEYFDQQSTLTDSISNRVLRAELQTRDQEEREAYGRWLVEGERMVSQAIQMRNDLTDMDTVIRKQQLTVSMLNQFSQVNSIPTSARSLHASLDTFRLQSNQLARDLSREVFSEG